MKINLYVLELMISCMLNELFSGKKMSQFIPPAVLELV